MTNSDPRFSAATEHALLPCPFCGGRAIWQDAEGGQATNFEPVHRVNCSECYRVDMPWWGDKIDCIKQWNARTGDAAQDVPERGSPEWFCQWLRGYLGCITGRDELDAFEANSIRSELAQVASQPSPAAPVETPPRAWLEAKAEVDAGWPERCSAVTEGADLLGEMKHGHADPVADRHYAWAVAEITQLRHKVSELIDEASFADLRASGGIEPQSTMKLEIIAATEDAPRDWFEDLTERVGKGLNAPLEPSAGNAEAIPEGFVSVELLQIARATADRLREENAILRASSKSIFAAIDASEDRLRGVEGLRMGDVAMEFRRLREAVRSGVPPQRDVAKWPDTLGFDDRDKYIDELEAQIERLRAVPQPTQLTNERIAALEDAIVECSNVAENYKRNQAGRCVKAIRQLLDASLALSRPAPHAAQVSDKDLLNWIENEASRGLTEGDAREALTAIKWKIKDGR
ncbi:Lar family restriction alleviation protein [Bradyrhizobium sp. 168]|uniref:Lar family restriction alleviation protein n=1 Tax=Bradyrhizobium sp. 168 TaxID=2782639 RepID=UPI001FFAAC14|nr:Lar family restriction alleviation protein [Bradyrhizobium sp. 168]MCK1585453.1 Lar family restriction alleviation protein [Bradyrhizobium sp. 168]